MKIAVAEISQRLERYHRIILVAINSPCCPHRFRQTHAIIEKSKQVKVILRLGPLSNDCCLHACKIQERSGGNRPVFGLFRFTYSSQLQAAKKRELHTATA